MFLLIAVSTIARDYNWANVQKLICSMLPYHESLLINVQGKQVPLKYTIERTSKGIEIIAASTMFNGVKSRFIYDGTKKISCVDFPRKNIRAWVLKNGEIILRPIFKEKGFNPSLVKGFSKLAELHINGYLKTFAEELRS